MCSALDLSVLNMEGNFGTFLTDDFFSYILNRNPFHKLATLDISFNDQGGVRWQELKYEVSLGCSSNTKPEAKMF